MRGMPPPGMGIYGALMDPRTRAAGRMELLSGIGGGSQRRGLDLSSAFQLGEDFGAAEDEEMPVMQGDSSGISDLHPALIEMTRRAMQEGDAPTSEDKGLALAQAGFAMAAGDSPHALQNMGRGAMAGVSALQDLRQQRALQRMKEVQALQAMARLEQQAASAQANAAYRDWLIKNGMQDNDRAREQFLETKRHNMAMEDAARNDPTRANQQSDAFQLADGTVVKGMFNPNTSELGYQGPNGWLRMPHDARPVTPSAGASLNRAAFNKLENEFLANNEGLRKMDSYLGTVENSEQGWALAADKFMASMKTLMDSGELTPGEFATREGQAKLQGLLGANRIEVVGPGAMTEYDAGRVLSALGGDVNMWRNKEVVARVLKDLYEEKRRRSVQFRDQLVSSGTVYGKGPADYVIPEAVNFNKNTAPTRELIRGAGGKLVFK